ncbi:Hypothetical protein, putative [Bodo saltans]|uniref:Uncharacterized protein n=1 Tax=Bodo saltans TaxID=75058 RepID=A0A0S4JTX5_BODSA|nr:Hypothetical protein, putative [Bodo saltans]|eukprot:CUG92878.1 Hypothetical protein, putative [Bodo saltans]
MSRVPLRWQPPEGREKINWETITGLPLSEFEKGDRDISALDKMIDHALKYKIDENDRHFSDPRFSSALARLYRLLLSKCDYDANEYFSKTSEQTSLIDKLKEQHGVAEERVQRLLDEKSLASQAMQSMEVGQESARTERMKLGEQIQVLTQDMRNKDRDIEKHISDLESLRKELNRMTRERDDLRRASESRVADMTKSDTDRNKIFEENQFLIKRYKDAADKLTQTTEALNAVQQEHLTLRSTSNNDILSLKNQLAGLQQENLDLIQARNRAEDLCERRETQALQDMSEVQQAYKDMLAEEQRRYQQLREEYLQLRDEFELSQRHRTHIREVEERDEIIVQLKNEVRQLRNAHRSSASGDDSDTSSSTVQSTTFNNGGADMTLLNKVLAERQKFEQENDTLQGELAALEVKCEQQDSQVLKLQKRLTEYERGDEGLRRLRQELTDANRTTEQLQDEAHQLRERLAHMEDVASFCTSLKLLCKRVGVTQEEIDRLQGSTNSRFGELDILRQETASLKEEIEWLEKERRYWMNKVRLQPLLDTRLRFELGLTSEQLKQLDHIVDQMKVGSVVVEDTEGAYREKYLSEVKLRQRDVEEFNEKMRSRIEEVLSTVMSSVLNATGGTGEDCGPTSLQNFTEAVEEMRRRSAETAMLLAGAATSSAANVMMPRDPQLPDALTQNIFQPTKQMESLRNKLDEVERMNNDLLQEASRLRERLAGVEGQLLSVTEERDAYRAVVFDAAQSGGTAAAADDSSPNPPSAPLISSSLLDQSRSSPSPARRLGIGSEVVPLLKEQLKMKELRLQQLAGEYDAMKATSDSERARLEVTKKECEVLEAKIKTVDDRTISLTATLQMSSERISELERINDDLHRAMQTGDLAPTSRELLQKIILLRQRESKLLQRVRIATQDRDEALSEQNSSNNKIEALLKQLKGVLRGEADGFVLPPSTAQHASETEALRVLQRQLSALSHGTLFAEDRKFLRDMRSAVEKLETIGDVAVLQKQLRATKLDAEKATYDAHVKILELEGTVAKLRASGSVETGSSAAMEVESNTWRQKCSLYTKRLTDRDADVAQLEDDLGAARQLVLECKQEIATLIGNGQETPSSNATNLGGDHDGPQAILKYEKEIARLKSVNLGLLQTSLDLQSDKKRLEIQASTAKKHLQLVKDSQTSGDGSSQAVSDFVVAALKDNSNLQQQCELSQYQLKKTRLQLLATEANFRVVANEAGAYKLSAHRLFKHYAEQVVKIVDSVRQLHRDQGSSISSRRALAFTQRLLAIQKLADREHDRFVNEKLSSIELHSHIDILKDELDLLTTKGRDGLLASDLLEKSKTVELRAQARSLQRKNQELQEDRDHILGKLARAEQNLCEAEREATLAESSGKGVVGEVTDVFFAKLQELRDTVFAKSESPPVAVTMTGSHGVMAKGIEDGDRAVQEFKASLEKQAELSKRCTLLQQQLSEARQSLSLAETKTTAMREETIHLQQQLVAASHQLEEERGRLITREERLTASHQNQLEVMQRAVDHNTQCLKDLLSGKEGTIQKLQQQLQAERQRYLEHQLLDTTRMERLHEQLFKENNTMLERFKASMDINGALQLQANGQARVQDLNSSVGASDTAQNQMHAMTQEVMQLRLQVKDLRTRNIMLESQLNDQISAAQRQMQDLSSQLKPTFASGGSGVMEHSLTALNRDQQVALENIRRREHELLSELQRSQEEVKRLHNEVFDLRTALIDQADAANRNAGNHVLATTAAPTLVNEMRTQIAELNRQLQEARSHLVYEKAHARHTTSQSAELKQNLQQLQQDMTQGTVHVDHARQIVAANSQLRSDLDAMRDQSDKMQNAMAMLKQTLVMQTQSSGEREQKLQQEVAIAQRMSVLQQQSSETINHFQAQIGSMQTELQARVLREEDLLRKGKSAQLFAEEQHRLLIIREKEVLDLKRELQAIRTKAPSLRPSRALGLNTQPPTWKDAGVQVIASELNPVLALAPPPAVVQLAVAPAAEAPSVTSQAEGGASPLTLNVPAQPDPLSSETGDTKTDLAGTGPRSHARVNAKKKPVALQNLPSNEQVAGLVSRQLAQFQKEKQLEVDQLKQQLKKLEVTHDEATRHATAEKAIMEQKFHAATSTANILKSKLEQLEAQHREELLRYLEERNNNRPTKKHSKKHSEGILHVVKEQGVQTEGPSRPLSQVDIPKVAGATSEAPPVAVNAQPPVLQQQPNVQQANAAVATTAATAPGASAQSTLKVSEPITPQAVYVAPSTASLGMSMTPQPTASTPSTGAAHSTKAPVPHFPHRTVVSSACQTDGSGPASGPFGETKSHQTKKWLEMQTANADLKVQEMIRKLRRDNDRMNKELEDHAHLQKELSTLRDDLKKKVTELEQLKSSQRGAASNEVPASPLEIRSHKRDLLRLEEYVDQLRRDLNVKKEIEMRELILNNDRLTSDIRRLEAENAKLRGGSQTTELQADNGDTGNTKTRELENKLLTQEGILLDLRFERETLAMKVSRLERHLNDVMAIDSANAALKPTAGPNVGRKRETSGKEVAALEAVIENMKLVVERMQAENMSLKANSVSSAQFMEAAREVKHLRQRERVLLEKCHEQHRHIEELQAAVLPGSKMSEQYSVLQRRLRMTQAASEQYQLELFELRSRLGEQQRQDAVQFAMSEKDAHQSQPQYQGTSSPARPASATTPSPRQAPYPNAGLSPYAAELHRHLPHHTHAH